MPRSHGAVRASAIRHSTLTDGDVRVSETRHATIDAMCFSTPRSLFVLFVRVRLVVQPSMLAFGMLIIGVVRASAMYTRLGFGHALGIFNAHTHAWLNVCRLKARGRLLGSTNSGYSFFSLRNGIIW